MYFVQEKVVSASLLVFLFCVLLFCNSRRELRVARWEGLIHLFGQKATTMKVCIVQLLFMGLREPHFLRKRTGKELKRPGSFSVMTYFHSKEEIQKHCRIFFFPAKISWHRM